MALSVYLDACCLNRPFDDPSQARIRLEAEAVLLVIHQLTGEEFEWVGSQVLDFELAQVQDPDRRLRVALLLAGVERVIALEPQVVERAKALERLVGFSPYDALHVACAEQAGAAVLLTTDDKMIRLARRNADHLRVRVANPVEWIQECE